jgi:hypothetical protein
MQTSTTTNQSDRLALPAKAEWEDPAITLERDLEARAQGGPTDSQFAPLGILGPMGGPETSPCVVS